MPTTFRKRVQGFSLVQFMVTLTILLALAALLFPIFGKSRGGESRRSVCQSNLKRIGLALKQYTQDNGEKFPMWQRGANPATGWAATLRPYIQSEEIYQCPNETTRADSDPAAFGYCDYFYSSNIGPQTGGHSEAFLDNSASTIILGDSTPFSAGNATNGGTITSAGSPAIDGTQSGLAVAQGQWVPMVSGSRHINGGNYGFADGHVKWLPPTKVTRNPTSLPENFPTFRLTGKNPPVSGS